MSQISDNFKEDEDEEGFDCQIHSKEIFNELNKFKSNLNLLKSKITNIEIPSTSSCTFDNVNEVLAVIDEIQTGRYKGKKMMWNEKGYSALSNHFVKKLKGHKCSMDVKELFESKNIGKSVEHSALLKGKYDAETSALLLILKGSICVKDYLCDSVTFCSVSYVEAVHENKLKGFTSVAFSK